MPEFIFDPKNIYYLKKFYRKAPREFQKVMVNLMNNFAFGTRRVSLNIIKKHMVVRSPKWVNSRIQVRKARLGRMMSQEGSVASTRFTGWAEQEGAASTRTRVFGLAARRGDIKKRSIGQSRLKPGSNFITADQYQGKTARFRTTAMLMDIRRNKIRKSFIIKRSQNRKFKTGLYMMRNNKIQLLQQFKKRTQPKRVRWSSGAVDLYMTPGRLQNEWANSIVRVLDQYKGK